MFVFNNKDSRRARRPANYPTRSSRSIINFCYFFLNFQKKKDERGDLPTTPQLAQAIVKMIILYLFFTYF